MASTLTCLNCGETVRLADRFCSHCGDELTLSSHPTAMVNGDHDPYDDPESPWVEVVHRLRRATAGEFEVGRELGRGGMAAVFLAHESSLDRKVAIKVMSPGLLMGDGMIERFRREAITIAHLNHPNIVSCYSVRQAAGLHFFVMRYIRGRSLEQVIHDAGRLPAPIVRSILCQVGSALTYAHRSGVVHRDIKPANILIDEDGNAVVTDFGIAKVAQLPGSTHSGALVGTPAYMSPEQCGGGEISGATDQYSLGAVAYEMITGTAPFTGSTLTVMNAQVETAPPAIGERVPDCPPDLEAAILRMLAKDPAERFPSMADAKTALGAVPLTEDDPLLAQLTALARAGVAEPETPPRDVPMSSSVAASVARSAVGGQARSVVVLPPPAELASGDSFALIALVRGERGLPLLGREVVWTTDRPEVLHLDLHRKVATAVGAGSAALTASCDGIEARVQIRVPPSTLAAEIGADAPPAAIQISAPPKSVRTGDSFILTATPLDHEGRPMPDAPVLWSTSDVRVAVVTAEGWVAALGRGQVVLTATRGVASGSVTIGVEEAIPVRPRARPAEPASHEEREVATDHRSTWRRRGTRSRQALVRGVAMLALVAGCVWLFGGLRDFRWSGDLAWLAAEDSSPVSEPADSVIQPAESLSSIDPGPASSSPTDSATASINRARGRSDGGASVPSDNRTRTERRSPAATSGGENQSSQDTTTFAGTADLPTAEDDAADTFAYLPSDPLLEREERERAAPVPAPVSRPPMRSPGSTRAAAARPPAPPIDRRELESRMRKGLDECYGAVRSKDLERLADLYSPKSYADEEKLRKLTTILRTEPWRAMVGKRVDGVREMSATAAAAEFSFRLAWRGTHGGQLSSQPIFRAEFSRDTNGWAMSSCRIVGSPQL